MSGHVIVKTYKGSQSKANALFQADATKMAADNYFPISQSWAPGSYGCGSFLLALVLCFVLIGFIVFIYMIIVKPDGTLSVTYEFHDVQNNPIKPAPLEEKTCPKCAEQVKSAAKICRFCGYEFPSIPTAQDQAEKLRARLEALAQVHVKKQSST